MIKFTNKLKVSKYSDIEVGSYFTLINPNDKQLEYLFLKIPVIKMVSNNTIYGTIRINVKTNHITFCSLHNNDKVWLVNVDSIDIEISK